MFKHFLKSLAIVVFMLLLLKFVAIYNANLSVPKKNLDKLIYSDRNIVEKQENILENNGTLVNCADYSRIHEGKIHIISSIIFFMDPKYKDNLLYKNETKATNEQIWDRIKEVAEVIQDNLNHEAIGTLHLLVETESAFSFVNTIRFENQSKLFVYRNIRIDPDNIFNIALRCFPSRNVLYLSQDITLGEGWNRLNLTNFNKQRVAYVLTRHASPRCITERGTCMKPYRGSNDAYFFYVYKYLDVFANNTLTGVTVVGYGFEVHMIGWLRNVYELDVVNPCQQLVTYHQHCVPIREANRERQGGGNIPHGPLSEYETISNDIITPYKQH